MRDDADDADLEELYTRAGFLLRRGMQRATAIFSDVAEGMTTTQFGALYILSRRDGLDQKDLARLLKVDKTTAGVVVRSLEKHGYIRRARSARDKRQNLLAMTQSGRIAYAEIERKAADAQHRLLGKLSEEERATLKGLLRRLIDP